VNKDYHYEAALHNWAHLSKCST